MLDWFRKVLGADKPTHAPEREAPESTQFDLLNKVAPLAAPAAPATSAVPAEMAIASTRTFVCREPVLNRNEKIAGYAFSLHEKLQLRLQGEKDLLQKVYDDALLRNLTSLGVNTLLGHRLAFVRLSPASLGNPLIQRLPTDNTVLMMAPARQALDPATLQPQLDALRQAGFAYGWLLRKSQLDEHPALQTLAAHADYAQIETAGFDGLDIKLLLKTLVSNRPANLPRLRLVAQELDTFDEFNLCFQGGFDFFSGQFVTSRENWHPPKSDINRLHVIELLNLLRGGEELSVIAEKLTHDPVMTFKLLRYINSPAMGLQSPVTAMDKGLIVLGRERFYRWLSLLLFDIKAPGYRERILVEEALTRAYFLESLAGTGKLPPQKDQLFILGLFSMLELLMGQPIDAILKQTRLPTPVQEALLEQPGILRDALLLAVAAEGRSSDLLEQQAIACGLDATQVARHAVEALNWANEIMSMNEG